MDTTISASKREGGNKSAARQIRKSGMVPAVVYGPGTEPTPIAIEPRALTDIFRHSQDRNTIVELDIDGTKEPTLVREVQRHPVSRDIVHVDFYRVAKDRKVEVMVPVSTSGRAQGAIFGGRVRLIRRTVRTRCDYDKIPKEFDVDVTPLNIGDMVMASQIVTPEGVEVIFDNDFNVVTLYGKKVKATKTEEE